MKKKLKLGFVILHYLALEMTQKCVNAILNTFNNIDIYIVIVDNASYNGSGNQLSTIFERQKNINVILNEKNEGFARGNNIGFLFLKENFDCDYIIIMNNDVIIEDEYFFDKIIETYEKVKFDILGPDIYVPSRKIHQNPVNIVADFTKKDLNKKIKTLKLLNICFPINFRIYCSYWKLKNMITPKKITKDNYYESSHINPLLHGACYIFSKKYIANHTMPFNPDTFLFFEEDILYHEAMKEGLLLYYNPEITVNHLEDVSTNIEFKTYYQKEKMKTKEQLKSALVFKKLMEE
ncbi:glycosyltransferase [Erysipelotrichaceae bacterium 66-17]|nr:rhamnosyltransferase [Erysipelotrichaceae bacterium OPF54]